MIDDDIEISEVCCKECGRNMHQRPCTAFDCDDGFYDGYEEDPFWYDPGDYIRCSECKGKGYFRWCPNPTCETGGTDT